MRILHFYRSGLPDSMGGIEQTIHQIALQSKSMGMETDVLFLSSANGEQTMDKHGYRIHRARLDGQIASTDFSFSALFRFARLAGQADIIHYHFPWPFMDIVHFLTPVCRPTVVTYHSDIVRQQRLLKLYRPLQHLFLSKVDRIVATSPNYLATSSVLKRYADKVDVIPIGLDKASYPQPGPERCRFWQQRFGPRFFLFVGVLRYYKGLHVLIEAARHCPYPIVIVGTEPGGDRTLTQVKLPNLHFLGYLPDDDKVALLKSCYAVVFPPHLRAEAFGIGLLEGTIYGKALISTEIGTGTSFINNNGETGLVIRPNDANALQQAMETLWANPKMTAAMGKRAEKRYWQYFTAERMAAGYARLYRTLLAK
jgi:glycosyltransferase involved in cell wall biosynthesis